MSLKGLLVAIMMQSMVIHMNDQHLQTLAQLQAFLDGTAAVDFTLAPGERYGFIGRTVRCFTYRGLKRAQKAVVLRFFGAGERLFTPAADPLGQARRRARAAASFSGDVRGSMVAPVQITGASDAGDQAKKRASVA